MFRLGLLCLAALGARAQDPVDALILGGQNFAMGAAAFADRVQDYKPGYGAWKPYRIPEKAAGTPNQNVKFNLDEESAMGHVALGFRGYIELEFQNNRLIKGGDNSPDLMIFGTELNRMNVFIRENLESKWYKVSDDVPADGKVNIDGGAIEGQEFRFVRLENNLPEKNKPKRLDTPNKWGMVDPFVGPFIDAVGCISSGPPPQNAKPPVGIDPDYYPSADLDVHSTGAGVEMFVLKRLGKKAFLDAVTPKPDTKLTVEDNVVAGFSKLKERVHTARDELVKTVGTKVENMMEGAKDEILSGKAPVEGDESEANGDAKKNEKAAEDLIKSEGGDDKKKTAKASMLQQS